MLCSLSCTCNFVFTSDLIFSMCITATQKFDLSSVVICGIVYCTDDVFVCFNFFFRLSDFFQLFGLICRRTIESVCEQNRKKSSCLITNMNTNNTFEATNLSVARFNYVDYAIVLSLLMISLTIGVFIRFSKYRSTTTADFLFAGYKMKSLPVALSLLAR